MTERNQAPDYDYSQLNVELVYDVQQLTVTDAQGRAIREETNIPRPVFKQLSGQAFDFYLENGPGLYDISGTEGSIETASLRLLGAHLPPQAFRYGNLHEPGSDGIRTTWVAYFGNLAISGRKATRVEIGIHELRTREQLEQKRARQRRILEMEDMSKQDYLRYDRAVMRLGSQTFTFGFDNVSNIIAFRVLKDLQELPENTRISLANMRDSVWEAMPLVERLLFTNGNENRAYAPASKTIDTAVRAIRDSLLTEFYILDRRNYRRTPTRYELELFVEPDTDSSDTKVIPVYPPGTPQHVLDEAHSADADRTTLKRHTDTLGTYMDKTSLEPNEAIALLDIIMTREGKLALLNLYRQEFPRQNISDLRREIEATLTTLHNRAKRALGVSSYTSARVNRTIAGNITTGANAPVQQIGGRLLPDRTKEVTFKGWVIGRPQTLLQPSVVDPPTHIQR